MKAWSLVSLLEAARTLAQLACERSMVVQAPVPSGQPDISWALILDPGSIREFASALHSASFAKVNVAQPWISTAIKAPQPTRRCQVVVLAPLLVRRWHILRDGASAAVGRTKIALRGHRLS